MVRLKFVILQKIEETFKYQLLKYLILIVEKQGDSSLQSFFSLFLWIGQIFDFVHISGNVLYLMQFLKMIEKTLTRTVPNILIMWTGISSSPCALLMPRHCNIFIIISSVKVIGVIVALVTCDYVSVSVLLLERCALRSQESIKKMSFYLKIRD